MSRLWQHLTLLRWLPSCSSRFLPKMLLVVRRFPGSSHSVQLFETATLPALGFQSLSVASDAAVRNEVRRRFSIHIPTDHFLDTGIYHPTNPLCFWAYRLFLPFSRIRLSTRTNPRRTSTSPHRHRDTNSGISPFCHGHLRTIFADGSSSPPHLLSRPHPFLPLFFLVPPASPTDVRFSLSGTSA